MGAPPMDASQRITIERKRLNMSQAAFAQAAGVSLSTQKRYEKGERGADSEYLAALSKIGVDIVFILTGLRSPDADADRRGLLHVLELVAGVLDIARGEIGRDFDAALAAAVEAHKYARADEAASAQADLAFEAVLRRSPLWLSDPHQLEAVVEKVEFVLEAQALKLSPAGKSRAIVSLLRQERRSGRSADLTTVQKALQEHSGL